MIGDGPGLLLSMLRCRTYRDTSEQPALLSGPH